MTVKAQKDLMLSFRDEIAIIEEIVMKGKRIIIQTSFQGKALNQPYMNHSYGHRKEKTTGTQSHLLDQHASNLLKEA